MNVQNPVQSRKNSVWCSFDVYLQIPPTFLLQVFAHWADLKFSKNIQGSAGNNGRSLLWKRDFSEYFQHIQRKIL